MKRHESDRVKLIKAGFIGQSEKNLAQRLASGIDIQATDFCNRMVAKSF
jgi:hypothetical protein